MDGVQVGQLITPTSDAFAVQTSAAFTVGAGEHELRLAATDGSGDRSTFIDQVSLVPGSADPGTPLPAGWTTQDVGSVGFTGAASQSSGLWTVQGSGADIWNTADGFRFAGRAATGDVQVTARVTSIGSTHVWAKAGVMIRSSLTAGSAHASTFATSANGLVYQRRLTTSASSGHTSGPAVAVPAWVRLERVGNLIISSTSMDGSTWSEIRRETIALGATVYVGLAVTSHDNAQVCTATFTDVQVVGAAAASN